MTANTKFNSYVSLPISHIKAPGSLLKDKKDPKLVKPDSKMVQDLFQSVFEKNSCGNISHSQLNTHGSAGILSTEAVEMSKSSYRNSLAGISCHLTEHNFISNEAVDSFLPNETQCYCSEKFYMQIAKIAKKMTSVYGIELLITISNKYYEVACEVLKFLVSEICSFHVGFFKKIKLEQLILSTSENKLSSEKDVLVIDELTVEEKKLSEAFYRIIFHHLALSNPLFLQEWKEIEKQEETYVKRLKDFSLRVEESFVANFMSFACCKPKKPKMEKLEKLLIKYYPEEMSLSWFCNRNKEKTKAAKVSFVL